MNTEKGAVMADVSVEARVEQLMRIASHFALAVMQDPMALCGAAHKQMQGEFEAAITAALTASNQGGAEGAGVSWLAELNAPEGVSLEAIAAAMATIIPAHKAMLAAVPQAGALEGGGS